MDWTLLIVAGVAVLGTLSVGLVYYFIVGPVEHAAGVRDAEAVAKAKADGLKIGADAVQKMADQVGVAVDAKTAATKQRDPVDVANDIILQRLGIGKRKS